MPNCKVRVIVGNQRRRYILTRFDSPPAIHLTICVNTVPYDLNYIVDLIKRDIVVKQSYNVHFDFKSTPKIVKTYGRFKEELLKIFHTPKYSDCVVDTAKVDSLIEIVSAHIARCGNSPDMSKYYQPKTLLKIRNYIRNILDIPELSEKTAILIAQGLTN